MRRNVLRARGLCVVSPGGRPLVRDLNVGLCQGDRVALVGRNGVGKSTLLGAFTGDVAHRAGSLSCEATCVYVPQELPTDVAQASRGEVRREMLRKAFVAAPELLLLDEPTQDLDRDAIAWLVHELDRFDGALLVASHDRRVLRTFGDFFIVAEQGCRHFSGSFDALLRDLERADRHQQVRYRRHLAGLVRAEERSAADRTRRLRKKHLGRVREIGRCPARALLNDKRSYAQEKQAKRRLLREARIGDKRAVVKSARRALPVHLPLALLLPPMAPYGASPIVCVADVPMLPSLRISRERIGVTGPNGSGKSTLVELLAGERIPASGVVRCDVGRIGYVAQDSSNWRRGSSVVDHLMGPALGVSPDMARGILHTHRFPLALAQRPLASLSPGERLRAALICLCQRRPAPELLILDEPTAHLDLVGVGALESFLRAWPGALVVVSHDEEFLANLDLRQRLVCGPTGVRWSAGRSE